MANVNYNPSIKGSNFTAAKISIYNGEKLLATMTANEPLLADKYVGLTGYFEENTTQEQANSDSEADSNWDYTAFVGTDKPTVMKVELTDKEGNKTINEYPVTL